MDSAYFALIYNFLTNKVEQYGVDMMNNATGWVANFAFILVTLWVFFRGYRMVTGQSHESMMTTVTHMIKVSLIVAAAKAWSVGGNDLYDLLYKQLPQAVNQMVNGSDSTPASQIDKNLVLVSAASSAIDMVQVPIGDVVSDNAKARAAFLATIGIAAPAMTAGAMLLMYQVALALIVGLAPLFILSLMFEQTKDLFRRWLTYAIGTMFSMAVLSGMIAIVLDLTYRVAGAIWSADLITRLADLGNPGFNTAAMQQGGVGLLMTVIIITTPPMAAAFFNGAMGNFIPAPQVSAGKQAGGSAYSGGGGYNPAYAAPGSGHAPAAQARTSDVGSVGSTGGFSNPATTQRNYSSTVTNPDAIKSGGSQV